MFRIRCQTSKCFSYRNVHVSGTEKLSASRGEGREAPGHSAPALRRRRVKAADRPALLLQGSVRPQDTAALSQQVRNHGRPNAPKEGPRERHPEPGAQACMHGDLYCSHRPCGAIPCRLLGPGSWRPAQTPPSWQDGVRTQAHIPAALHRPSSALGRFSGGGGMTEHPETRCRCGDPAADPQPMSVPMGSPFLIHL